MADLSTKYLGITLRNPIIVGSSGLTNSVEKIQDLEKKGAGAVVLKSIFEEEIAFEYADFIKTETQVIMINILIMRGIRIPSNIMIMLFERKT